MLPRQVDKVPPGKIAVLPEKNSKGRFIDFNPELHKGIEPEFVDKKTYSKNLYNTGERTVLAQRNSQGELQPKKRLTGKYETS